MKKPITVIGSGLSGTLLALYLAQAGYAVKLYERRPDPRRVAQPAGRSINLALSARGLYALEEVGLKAQVLEQALPMKGRMMHDPQGQLTFQPYGLQAHEYINSISRSYLNQVLMDAAEASQVQIYFGQRCEGMDLESGEVQMRDLSTGKPYTLHDTPVLGADGAGSALRQALIQRVRVNYAQDYLEHGYKELTIPPGPDGDFQLAPEALHIWPRKRFMLIALPNPDRSFTGTLFLDFEGPTSFASLDSPAAVEAFFTAHFADLWPLIPDLPQAFVASPTGVLSTLRTAPWYAGQHLLLLGDAAHAIVPFFGQGMNAAFEDCTILLQTLRQHGLPDPAQSWQAVFADFYRQRKPDADAIADMALDNFIEMRDRVADPAFLLHKQVSLALEARYPDCFIPKYSLVSFHRVPYALAQQHGDLQQAVLHQLCSGLQRVEELNWSEAERLVQSFRAAAPPLQLN